MKNVQIYFSAVMNYIYKVDILKLQKQLYLEMMMRKVVTSTRTQNPFRINSKETQL